MKTKLLPTMIGAIMAGSMTAAAADVTVFGHIDESIVFWDDNSSSAFDDDVNLQCTTCSIGFKGSEDLGNGLKAIFKLDFEYDINERNGNGATGPNNTTAGSKAITDRDQWVGLAGNFGQVTFGSMSTTYKSHGAMIDPGYRTSAQMRDWGIQSNLHSSAGEEGQGRATNTVRYDSPSWNGLKVGATYTLDSNEDDNGNGIKDAGDEDDDPYGLGVSYENGGILVYADYITNDTGGSDEAYKLGGKYTLNNFSVFGQYEFDEGLISSKSAGNSVDGADVWMLGASYTMGNNTIYGAYGQGDDASGTVFDEGYDSWEVVGVHAMSKQTLVYAGYATIEPDDSLDDDFDGFTLGMKHKF